VGHSEGTALAVDLVVNNPKAPISTLILIGVMGQNLKKIFHYQTVQAQIKLVFDVVDTTKDGTISKFEIEKAPAMFKLPLDIIDTNKNKLIEKNELDSILELQYIATIKNIKQTPDNELVYGFNSRWWKEHFKRRPNILKASFLKKKKIIIMHGKLDPVFPY
jgi:hypothetical protein